MTDFSPQVRMMRYVDPEYEYIIMIIGLHYILVTKLSVKTKKPRKDVV